MKKIILSTIATVALVQATELPYKIFVETFSSPNDPRVEITYNKAKNELKDFTKAKVLHRPSDDKYVVVVEGIMEKQEAKKLLKAVRSIPGHSDAFILPAPELLKAGSNKYDVEPIALKTSENSMKDKEEMSKVDDMQTGSLQLQDVIKTVLEQNPDMKSKVFNYMDIGKDLNIAKNAYYPTLDFMGVYGYQKAKNSSTKGKFENGDKAEASLNLVQNIYNGGADANKINQEYARLDAAAFLIAEKADRLSLETISSYLGAIKEYKLLKIAQENAKVHNEIFSQIKDRVNSGYSKTSEERQAGSRLTLAQANLVAQENKYEDAISTFTKIYGKRVSASELIWPSFNIVLPNNEQTVKDKAFTCNPTIKNQEANIKLANQILSGTDAAFLPKLDFEAGARVGKNDNEVYDRDDSYDARLRLRYNIFNKGINSLEKQQEKIKLQKEQQSMDSIRRNLQESLSFSWQSYVLSQKKMDYVKENVVFSKETLESYQDEFKIGRRDLINLLDAQSEYFSAEKELVATEYDLLYAKYRLLDNMGLLADSFEAGFAQKYIKSACSIKTNLQ